MTPARTKPAEKKWAAERNRKYARNGLTTEWIIRHQPNPGGTRNADGTRTLSLSFPALVLTDWVSGGEEAAAKIAAALNDVDELEAENARLREALRPFAARANFASSHQVVSLDACKRAAAALVSDDPDFLVAGVVPA